jgi:hypothetical protein
MLLSVATVQRRQHVARGDARKPGDATPHCGRRLTRIRKVPGSNTPHSNGNNPTRLCELLNSMELEGSCQPVNFLKIMEPIQPCPCPHNLLFSEPCLGVQSGLFSVGLVHQNRISTFCFFHV